jgi:hypothetical protein
MNCPHCQKTLPENYTASYCPHCGGGMQAAEAVFIPPSPSPSPRPPRKIRLSIFFSVLLAPPLLTMLSAFVSRGQWNEQTSPAIAVWGGAAAGIACGVMLAFRLGKHIAARIILSILLSAVFGVVCIMLSFGGCMVAGYRWSFR